MKDFAKSIRIGNSNKEEIIKKKKEQGATLKVDNGQKLEFSDGTTYVKTSFSDDYREAHNHVGNKAIVLKDGDVWVVLYANETKSKEFDSEAEARKFAASVGNSRAGNSYRWEQMHGHQEFYNPAVPFGGHSKGFVEKSKNGYIGAKANGSIVISQKEFATEEEAKRYVETGNKKVGNSVPDNLHERFGYRLAVTKDGEGKKETISELEMAISDYKSEISEKERELNKDKQNLQKLEAVLRKYK